MRILHLIDGASPQASATTLALLAESLGRLGHAEQRVLLMGGSGLRAAAQAAGIRDAQLTGAPSRQVMLAWPAVSRAVRRMEWQDARAADAPGNIDLIHCWSLGALTLASLAWRRVPRVLTLTTPPSPSAVRWLRVLTQETGPRCILLPISATLRRTVLTGGMAEAAVHVLRPGLSMGLADAGARAALRKRWGVRDERIIVAFLLSDPPEAADALAGMMTVGLAEESSRDRPEPREFRLVIHPDQRYRRRAEAICRQLRRPARIIQEPAAATPWAVLPGCDLALAIEGGGEHDIAAADAHDREGVQNRPSSLFRATPPGLSLLWAMAANIPIVGQATYAISEIVEDHHSALLAKPYQSKAMAHRVTQLLDDPLLAYKLRDTARHEAYSFFSRQRDCESLRTVYEQLLAGQPIAVPPLPVTGGLRFTGRA